VRGINSWKTENGFLHGRRLLLLTGRSDFDLLPPTVNKTFNDDPMSNAATTKNVLNSDVEIKGNLKFAGELTFEGKLDGEINSDGTLHLGDSAIVNGNVNAATVIVRGKINGNVSAKDKIEIKAKTELFGDIRAAKLVIEEGVTFVGKTEVNPNKVAPTAGPTPGRGTTPAPPTLTGDAARSTEPAKLGMR
jgi:cytoskeletal protein CcmA (bactofilin family)